MADPVPIRSRYGLRLPPALRPGDRIAVLTPSWPGPDILTKPYGRGLDRLRQAGFDVVEYRRPATKDAAWVAGPARDRADDLHAAFADPSVRGIVCSIGGNFSAQILPWLDLDLVAARPKVFCGYSDITVLHFGLHRAGLLTFYGPAVIPQWGAVGGPMTYTSDHFRQVTGVAAAPCAVPRADVEVHDLDFDRAETTGMPLHRTPARPRRILRSGHDLRPDQVLRADRLPGDADRGLHMEPEKPLRLGVVVDSVEIAAVGRNRHEPALHEQVASVDEVVRLDEDVNVALGGVEAGRGAE